MMTIEKLMKPRYKVISDYPNSNFPVGSIINNGILKYKDGRVAKFDTELFNIYPHLFKKLEWWEERKETPQYLKIKDTNEVYEIAKGVETFLDGTVYGIVSEGKYQLISLDMTIPATEKDYNIYKAETEAQPSENAELLPSAPLAAYPLLAEVSSVHPSLCYTCENARKPASDTNIAKGYVGCSLRVMGKIGQSYDHEQIESAKEIAEGWVDLRCRITDEGSGIVSNFQLLTLEVKACRKYQTINLG